MNEVLSLKDRREEKENESEKTTLPNKGNDFNFEAIIKRNADNKSREKRDREKNNRGVTRSYRLKT